MAKIILTPVPTTADALHAAYERRAAAASSGSPEDWRRDHLGASLIGHECDRYLWLAFRWALNPKHSGRMLRLFDRGSREEAWIVEDLRAAGFQVEDRDPETGEQWRCVWHGGHMGGGLDGIVSGLLEASKTPHVLEVKTHNLKSFGKLKKDGVKRAKSQHYAQMQVYMRGRGLDRAFYVAVCKDNDEIYTERVHLDREAADALIERGRRIIEAKEPPPRQQDPAFPPCLYTTAEGEAFPCQFHDLCWGEAPAEKNCRTCVESTPQPDGTWRCSATRVMSTPDPSLLTPGDQRVGCGLHLTIPTILNAQLVAVDDRARRITYQAPSGRVFTDGGSP